MRRTRFRAVAMASVLSLMLFASTPLLPSAAAHHTGSSRPMGVSVNETITLPMNNWTAYEARVDPRGRIAYDILVLESVYIDLYIVPPAGLSMYRQHPSFAFTYYQQVENAYRIRGEYYNAASETLTVFFLLDNVDLSGAQPTGDVTVHVSLGPPASEPLPWIVLATCGIGLFAAVAGGIALAVRRRSKRRAAAALQVLPPPPPPP